MRGGQAQQAANPAQDNNNRVPEQPMPEARPADVPEGLRQRRRDPDAEQQENAQEAVPPAHAAAAAPEPQENALTANLLLTFLTSFFSSLIPERPQAAA
jgi:hypothetical protein